MTKYTKSNIHEDVHLPDEDLRVWAFYYENNYTSGQPLAFSTGLFSEHWHEYFEMINILEGTMTVECGGKEFEAHAGETLIFNPGEIHSCYKFNSPLKLYCVIFDIDILKSRSFDEAEKKYILPIIRGDIIFENHIMADKKISWLVKSICDEIKQNLLGYELAIKSYLLEFFVILLRGHLNFTLTESEKENNSRNYMRISEVLKYIDENYSQDLDIDELASLVFISKYYLCRLFKKQIGRTITYHINLVRITKAYELLVNTDLSITQVASDVGFSDANYFGRLYKRLMGHSPTSTRKLVLEKVIAQDSNFIRKKLNH